MTGSSTPTRSCLKRRLQAAKNSISSSLSVNNPGGRQKLCKTVSFDGNEHIYFADPDYDRHSVPIAPKLSYEDLLELKMLNVNLMCPQNRCAGVGIGILPLLPPSESTSATSSPASHASKSPNSTHSNLGRHLSARNQHFVGLLDDDLASVSSITPPPSSPSEHSPNSSVTPLPMIATDEEGQLIFDFSEPGDMGDNLDLIYNRRHESSDTKHHVETNGLPSQFALNLTTKLSKRGQGEEQVMPPPFPVLPSKQSQSNSPAFTLTPSFFALPPQPTNSPPMDTSDPSSPFPFAPPVPTTAGLGYPSLPSLPPMSNKSPTESDNSPKTTPTPSNLGSPIVTSTQHHRSTSSTSDSTSPLATPHASPTSTVPMHTHMRNARNAPSNSISQQHTAPVPGPLAALHLQHLQNHPLSPQLSGVPSPSLAPPSPLSLYPPSYSDTTTTGLTSSTTINGVMCSAPANPGGFFSAQKRAAPLTGHAKRASLGAPILRPTSPIVKPLKS